MEEIGEMIGKGFGVWRQQPQPLYSLPAQLLCLDAGHHSLPCSHLLVAMPSGEPEFHFDSELQDPQDMQDQIHSDGRGSWQPGMAEILQVAFLFFGMIVLLSLVEAFFTAGAIGMARQALEKGRADTGAMWSAGKKHFLNMFLLSILMGLITMAGLVFLLPGIVQISRAVQAEPQAMGMLIAGFLLFILYALVLSLMLAAAPYALVLEELGPRAGHPGRHRFLQIQ